MFRLRLLRGALRRGGRLFGEGWGVNECVDGDGDGVKKCASLTWNDEREVHCQNELALLYGSEMRCGTRTMCYVRA